MSKEKIVSDAVSAIQAGEAQVLNDAIGSAVDQAALEQKASDGTLTSSDLDAAVKAATDPLNASIAALQAQLAGDAETLTASQAADAQALADVQTKAASDIAAVQASLDAMTAKEQLEEGAVSDVSAKVAAAQQSLADMTAAFQKIMSVLTPPAPAPSVPVSS